MTLEKTPSSISPMFWTFLAGAAVGAVVVALTTPKTGPELRGDLKHLARRARRKAGELADDATEAWDGIKDRTGLAVGDVKRDLADSVNNLRA